MGDQLQAYREAIARRVHGICFDRNLDPTSKVNTEANCRIERFLPQLVELAKATGPKNGAGFETAVEHTICIQCGNQNALGECHVKEQADCCLYRYLPIVYETIAGIEAGTS